MRIVVTGASGNLGSALLPRLLAEPGLEHITGIARHVPDGRGAARRCAWRSIEIGADGAEVQLVRAFRGADTVVHLAWRIISPGDRDSQMRVNRTGSAQVFGAAVRAGVAQLVHLSSVAVYSPAPPADNPVREDWDRRGIATSAYSQDKVAVEDVLDDIETRTPQLRVSRVRPPTVVHSGAAQELTGMVLGPLAPLARMTRGRLPILPLPAGTRAQVIHGDDLADLIVKIITRGASGAFNAAADAILEADQIAGLLHGIYVAVPRFAVRAFMSAASRAGLMPMDQSWLDLLMRLPLLDTTRARTELGWRPRIDAAAAFAATVRAAGGR